MRQRVLPFLCRSQCASLPCLAVPLRSQTALGTDVDRLRYQGESDCGGKAATAYQCTFPAMIGAWRRAWAKGTDGQTDSLFPFGFVQLSAWGTPNIPLGAKGSNAAVPVVRFGQTANFGFVPNRKMPRTFMATAVDLGAFQGGCGHDTFPSLCIHPGFKAAVGARLARGARAVALNESGVLHQGPVFKHVALAPLRIGGSGSGGLVVSFDRSSVGAGGVEVREKSGFEVGVGPAGSETWTAAAVTASAFDSVTLAVPPSATAPPTAIRYLWEQNPCSHPRFAVGNCSVYCKAEGLPLTPFVARLDGGAQ
eukprot:SAG22_NODE_295_length_12850_cov_9.179202_8_plen_309_part_00